MAIYGYCRISKRKQSIDRQERNILEVFPTANIVKEVFTGTKIDGRKELDKLLKILKSGDTIVFDSASRMSRKKEEAINLYERLFKEDVNLIFLKEPHINSSVYKQAINNQINITINSGNKATDSLIKGILEQLNKYTIELSRQQIALVFEQAEKEVKDLQQRTKEGLITAKLNGKQLGIPTGTKLVTKKSLEAKEKIKKYSIDFNGTLKDVEVIKLINISRNSYYKYKSELQQEE